MLNIYSLYFSKNVTSEIFTEVTKNRLISPYHRLQNHYPPKQGFGVPSRQPRFQALHNSYPWLNYVCVRLFPRANVQQMKCGNLTHNTYTPFLFHFTLLPLQPTYSMNFVLTIPAMPFSLPRYHICLLVHIRSIPDYYHRL